jgi:hypothetical protein
MRQLQSPAPTLCPCHAHYAEASAELRWWYRAGELVRCTPDPPIHSLDATVTLWPGLVDDCGLKVEALPRPKSPPMRSADGDFEMEDGADLSQAVSQPGRAESSNGFGSNEEVPYPAAPHPGKPRYVRERPLPWAVRQRQPARSNCGAPAVAILRPKSYHTRAKAPPPTFYEPYRAFPSTKPQDAAAFNPSPPGTKAMEPGVDVAGQGFVDAAALYTLAVEVAAGVATCWTPTSSWVFKALAPPNSPAHSNSRPARQLAARKLTLAPITRPPSAFACRPNELPGPLAGRRTHVDWRPRASQGSVGSGCHKDLRRSYPLLDL